MHEVGGGRKAPPPAFLRSGTPSPSRRGEARSTCELIVMSDAGRGWLTSPRRCGGDRPPPRWGPPGGGGGVGFWGEWGGWCSGRLGGGRPHPAAAAATLS